MYSEQEDIEKIGTLMEDIQNGRISRNRHFFRLARIGEYKRFRRAKLFLSLLDDLRITSAIKGNTIKIFQERNLVQIHLTNPVLSYRRKIFLTNAELTLLKTKTDLGCFDIVSSHESA